jgi:hypothetical protein
MRLGFLEKLFRPSDKDTDQLNNLYTPMDIPPASQPEDLAPSLRIKKGDTVYITITGTADRKPMRVVNVTKRGEADELELEEV